VADLCCLDSGVCACANSNVRAANGNANGDGYFCSAHGYPRTADRYASTTHGHACSHGDAYADRDPHPYRSPYIHTNPEGSRINTDLS
jgi:hypothetical protein